jgi:hypothetical protein
MNKKVFKVDRDFQNLAILVDAKLKQNKSNIHDQEKQVNTVLKLEKSFKNSLVRYEKLEQIYKQFILYVKNDLGNILIAQSYFREKKNVFNKQISPCIKKDQAKEMIKFNINYNLISFIVERWGEPLPPRTQELYEKFLLERQRLIENNIPLAINRAKLFYRKTVQNDLDLLDLINICVSGLVVGIDKYAGAYSKVWRSVCIGRMVGFMIKEYSEPFIKLYPTDKKILYRANVLKYRNKIEDISELTKAVNESFIEDKRNGMAVPKLPISEDAIKNLLNSVHYISTDSKMDSEGETGGEEGSNFYDYMCENLSSSEYEEYAENKDSMYQLGVEIKNLDIISRKIIRLKGVDL